MRTEVKTAMIQSMTGFSRVELPTQPALSIELKSVNSRFLDLHLRLPETLNGLEAQARQRLKERLGRGKVELNLQWAKQSQQVAQINQDALDQALALIASIEAKMANPRAVSSLELMAWPGVLSPTQLQWQPEQVLAGLEQAIDQLLQQRQQEGASLSQHLRSRLQLIRQHSQQVRRLQPEILAAWQHKLRQRVAELSDQVDEQRLSQELAILAQKSDIAEELDRLDTHTEEAERILDQGGACGRKLDFLMQEFNREANTLASKALRDDVTAIAIDLKVLIEQMREQVQNIE